MDTFYRTAVVDAKPHKTIIMLLGDLFIRWVIHMHINYHIIHYNIIIIMSACGTSCVSACVCGEGDSLGLWMWVLNGSDALSVTVMWIKWMSWRQNPENRHRSRGGVQQACAPSHFAHGFKKILFKKGLKMHNQTKVKTVPEWYTIIVLAYNQLLYIITWHTRAG